MKVASTKTGRMLLALCVPAGVAGFMLAGALVFQMLLYLRYGESIFDNMDLPGADFAPFQHSPAVLRWPAQLVARACHLWLVQPPSAVTVLVGGTIAAWAWMLFRGLRHASRGTSPS